MDATLFPFLELRLGEAERSNQSRSLRQRKGFDFCSNDYLGFSDDIKFRRLTTDLQQNFPTGAAGSRLLRGNLRIHEEVEQRLAQFCGTESALLFPSGYQANIGLLSALLREGDHVFSDEENHASIIDGIRLGRAEKHVFLHNDLESLQKKLQSVKSGKSKFIVTESLFSMGGDFAPLGRLAVMAQEYAAHLIVDESHATGVYGDFTSHLGGGRVQELHLRHAVFATIHTGGKALGVGGAWIAGSSHLRDYLINFSRPFIFSTAITPSMTAMIGAALEYWRDVGEERALEIRNRSEELISKFARDELSFVYQGITIPKNSGPILPFIVGSNQKALEISTYLQERAFDLRAIRPPTVPEGTARIRLTMNWGTPRAEVERLSMALAKAFSIARLE